MWLLVTMDSHDKTEDWLANGHRGSSSYRAPMTFGRVLPRLVALRYCGGVPYGAGHMIYRGIVTWPRCGHVISGGLSHDMYSIIHHPILSVSCSRENWKSFVNFNSMGWLLITVEVNCGGKPQNTLLPGGEKKKNDQEIELKISSNPNGKLFQVSAQKRKEKGKEGGGRR